MNNVVFIVQIIIILFIVFYVYYTFRHCVRIPTPNEYVEQISPGLSELTKSSDKIIFWFYSLEEKKFKKYILSDDMKITLDTRAETYDVVNDLGNKFYFNFIQQRWEKKIIDKNSHPIIDKDRNIIEQRYTLCYINDQNTNIPSNKVFNVASNTICEERRNQAFIKLKIRNVNYLFNEKTLQLELDTKSMFLTNETMCKFTMNRYKEYLGKHYDQNNEIDNKELQIGVYFYRDSVNDKKWILKECERQDEMYFDGSVCKHKENKNILEQTVYDKVDLSKLIMANRIDEGDMLLNNRMLLSEETSQDDKNLLHSHYLKLNASHSAYVNLNVDEKIYSLDVEFYKSCHYTFFIVGQKKSDISDEYEWKLEQMINDFARNKMLTIKQQWCALIQEPRKIYNVQSGNYMYLKQPFVFYLDYVFYMREIFLKLFGLIESRKQYIITEESNRDTYENGKNDNVKNKILLPHVRKYSIENKTKTKYDLYATFAGNTIFDIYAETILLADYIEDIYKQEFFNRDLFPTISNDFQLGIWACAEKVDKPEMFTYISLVDMFGLEGYATTSNKIVNTV